MKSPQTGERLLGMESIPNGDHIEQQQRAMQTSGWQQKEKEWEYYYEYILMLVIYYYNINRI